MTDSHAPRRTRKDPRKEAARIAIIEAAESQFAQFGIDGVSLRQIGSSIGSSNNSVVAYHFGDKETLVEAIFHYRLPSIDARRQELLVEARQAGRGGNVFHLLRCLWLPLFEQINSQGVHSYAGFLAALMYSNMVSIRQSVDAKYPTTSELGRCLKAAMPEALRPLFEMRVMITALMVTGALKVIDQSDVPLNAQVLFEDTLRMTSSALLTPIG